MKKKNLRHMITSNTKTYSDSKEGHITTEGGHDRKDE